MGYRTKEQLHNNLHNFYVIKGNGLYAGHVCMSFGTPPEFEDLNFYNAELKTKLRHENVIYIEHIVTEIHHVGNGLGGKLFDYLYEHYPTYHFMSSVVVKPYFNEVSLNFHHKNDYGDVAYYDNDVIESNRYESVYLLRTCNE